MAGEDFTDRHVAPAPARWHGRIKDLCLSSEQRNLFVLLFGTYWHPLVRFAGSQTSRRRMSDIDLDVEGIVQESFIDLLNTKEVIENPAGWLFTVTSRKVAKAHVDLVKRKRLPEPTSGREAPGMPWLYSDDGSDRLTAHDVLTQLALLPNNQRVAMYLKLVLDWDDEEIAAYLGCARSTARVHMHRGRMRIGEALAPDYGTFHSVVVVIDDAGTEYRLDPAEVAVVEAPGGGGDFELRRRNLVWVRATLWQLAVLLLSLPCFNASEHLYEALPKSIQMVLTMTAGIVGALIATSIVVGIIAYLVERWNKR